MRHFIPKRAGSGRGGNRRLIGAVAAACMALAASCSIAIARDAPVPYKDDRIPEAISADDLKLYASWLKLSAAQENMVALSYIAYVERMNALRPRIASFQGVRISEPSNHAALEILRKQRLAQESLRSQVAALDSQFLAEVEPILAETQIPAMELVRNHRTCATAIGTSAMNSTGRPFVDLADVSQDVGLFVGDAPDLTAVLGEYERQLAILFRRLQPLADQRTEKVLERLCAEGHDDPTGEAGYEAARAAWPKVNHELLDVESEIDALTGHTAAQLLALLPAPLADAWQEDWALRWEPSMDMIFRLYHIALDVVKAGGKPMDDAQMAALRGFREQAVSAMLKVDNPRTRRHSPYESDLDGVRACESAHMNIFRKFRAQVFAWARQFDAAPAALNDPDKGETATRIEAGFRSDVPAGNAVATAHGGRSGARYEPLTVERVRAIAERCAVDQTHVATLSDLVTAYQDDLSREWGKPANHGLADRFAAMAVCQQCEMRLFDQLAAIVPPEKHELFEAIRQDRARSLLRANCRPCFGMPRADLGDVLLESDLARSELSPPQLAWLAAYHAAVWPALQEWAQASAAYYIAAGGADISGDELHAIFTRVANAAAAMDQANSRMMPELLAALPESERNRIRGDIQRLCYPEVLADKADVRPVIIAAQKAIANDADLLQKVMDIALPYSDEYDALNQAMIAALAGVTEWRSSPTNPGPACRDCEAKYQSLHKQRAELCGRTLIKLKAVLPEKVWLELRADGGLPAGAH